MRCAMGDMEGVVWGINGSGLDWRLGVMASSSAQLHLDQLGFDLTDITKSPQSAWTALWRDKDNPNHIDDLWEIIWRLRCHVPMDRSNQSLKN